jgi:hypothetical protein
MCGKAEMTQPDPPGGSQPEQGNIRPPSGSAQPPTGGAAEVSTYAPLPPDRLDGVSDLMIFG